MGDIETLSLAQMQWLGYCPQGWAINSEVGDLGGDAPPGGKWFTFLRYDVRLEAEWLAEHLDLKLNDKDIARVREMDNPESIPLAYEIGQRASERQVKAQHWIAPYADAPSAPL